MIEYRFASDEHRADIIDFINYVFSQSARPHDFKALIPKVYADGRGYSDIHAIALDGHYVRGVVAQLPQKFSFAGKPLMTGYIGSVSSYKYTRGSGHMIKLMAMQAEKAEEDGIDIMLLGGQRQRYEYYGYSPCGTAYGYSFIPANIRHALKNTDAEGIEFIPFSEACACAIDKAYELYLKQPVTGGRSREDFALILGTYEATPYIIKKDSCILGYVAAFGTESFAELVLSDPSYVKPVIKAWFAKKEPKNLGVSAASYDICLNRELASFAEGYRISAATHARIVNLKNVLDACLTLKAETTGLSDGRIVLKMDDQKAVCVEVKNSKVSVFETDEEADITLDRLSMQMYLFSANRFTVPDIENKNGWFPLPLHLYSADHF